MNSITTVVKGPDGQFLSSASSLEEMLRLLLEWKESAQEVEMVELYAVRLWILKEACYLAAGETVSVKSDQFKDLTVFAGKIGKDRVFVNDSDDVMEAKVSDMFWL